MTMFSTLRPGTNQTIAVGVASVTIAAPFGGQTYEIRLVSTTACHFLIGNGALTATTSHPYLPANVVEYFHVTPGQSIAAIQNAAGGTLHITEMTR